MDNERLDTNPSSNHTGKRIDSERRELTQQMLRDGVPILDIAKELKMSPNNVTAIKKEMPESTGLVDEFKSTTVRNLKAFVQQASHKLVTELDQLHVSQIPIAMGIAIDKIQTLQDQPQAVVEHRFSISHDALDKLLKARGQNMKLNKEGAFDIDLAQERPKETQNYLDWAKDPRSFLEKKVVDDNP